jgi:DNA-binding beta-propeller fold protein YncE
MLVNINKVDVSSLCKGGALIGLVALLGLLGGCAAPVEKIDRPILFFPKPPEQPRFQWETTIYNSANVMVVPDDVKFRMSLSGKTVPVIKMEKPYGIAVRQGRVYVTDTAARSVHVFDLGRKRYFRIGYRFDGALQKPLGIDTDSQGQIYVADAKRRLVVMYDGFGLFRRFIGGKADLVRPTSVAVNAELDRVYVVDTGGVESNQHRVVVYNREGKKLSEIGRRGSGDGEFNLPTDAAVGPDDNLYVLDAGNFRVQVFDAEGNFLRKWGQVGDGYGQFARPRAITVDDDGVVYVSDAQFGNIQLFNSEGRLLLFMGENGPSDDPMKFSLLAGVAADETGHLFAVDQRYSKVEVIKNLKFVGKPPKAGKR